MKKGFLLLTTALLMVGFLSLTSCGEESGEGNDSDSTGAQVDSADSAGNQEAMENLDNYNEEVNNETPDSPPAEENPDMSNQLGDDVSLSGGEETSTVAVDADVTPNDRTTTGRAKLTDKQDEDNTGGRAKIGTGDKTGGRAKIGGGN